MISELKTYQFACDVPGCDTTQRVESFVQDKRDFREAPKGWSTASRHSEMASRLGFLDKFLICPNHDQTFQAKYCSKCSPETKSWVNHRYTTLHRMAGTRPICLSCKS